MSGRLAARRVRIGDRVRYRPGVGTYGYDDMLERDGTMPATVLGFTRTRVRVRLTSGRTRRQVTRAVDAAHLLPGPTGPPAAS